MAAGNGLQLPSMTAQPIPPFPAPKALSLTEQPPAMLLAAGNDEIQSSSKKRKEHPVDMLANKTKTELLAEAHSAGIKGRHKMRKDQLILSIRNHLK
jgi:hypothetical protein